MISLAINGITVSVPSGSTILEACESSGIYIPTLCNHPDIPPAGKCGICVVKVNGSQYVLSCSTKAVNGMVIDTKSSDVKERALRALNKFNDMPMMPKSPEIEEVWQYFLTKKPKRGRQAECTFSISFNPDVCINCDRCIRRCGDEQAIGALDEESHALAQNSCISCGQCITVCPTAALKETNSMSHVLRAFAKGKCLVMQVSPACRVAVGELFGSPVGTIATGKILTAAREMGFKYIFDTSFGADLSIIEEGNVLLDRIKNGGVLPVFTSCCPAWINFVEKIHPDLIPNISPTKSPHMNMGRLIKTYFAEKKGINPNDIFVVSLSPCTAKKDERKRRQMKGDVDAVLTIKEFGELIKYYDLDWESLVNSDFDPLLGESSGASALFGVTGGVMESALRFIHEELTKTKLGKVEYSKWRGYEGLKTGKVFIGGKEFNVAVCNGIAHAREFIESGDYLDYHFIEVMACPSGCIAGGGAPHLSSRKEVVKRANALYEIDHQLFNKATANDNTELRELYSSYIGKPASKLAHQMFYTHYQMQTSPILELIRKVGNLPIVAFGSSSGTASKFSRVLAGYIGTAPIALNICGLQKIVKQGTAIIICSTFGDGEMPANAFKFYQQLLDCKEDLSQLRYAVCALGSKAYPKFCEAGKKIDQHLVERGAQRLLPLIEIDATSVDKGEGVFESWAPDVIRILGLKMPDIVVEPTFTISTSTNNDVIDKPIPPLSFDWGVLTSSTVLTPDDVYPSVRRYQIKVSPQHIYQTGDIVAILPQNDIDATNAILLLLKLEPTRIIEISSVLPEGMHFIPQYVTYYDLFSQYLDLNGLPNRNLIRAFKQFTKDTFTKERLEKILDNDDPRYFRDLAKDINICEFIIEYGKYGIPPIEVLVSAIPHIKPRLYSISSAPSQSRNILDLIITDNVFGPGNARSGLCSSFMKRFGHTRIAFRIQEGTFQYPIDNSRPIIMTAQGCGIAPMLSILQHREHITKVKADAALFFGCRVKNSFPILESILDSYKDSNGLQDLYISYSRDGMSKTYISDLIMKEKDLVWKYWSNPKTIWVYSGPPKGIPEQIRQVFVSISIEKGGMTRQKAEEFTDNHTIHMQAF